jgi:hypothetical protein
MKHFASSGRPGDLRRDRASTRLDRNLKTQKAAAYLLLLGDTPQFPQKSRTRGFVTPISSGRFIG